MKRQWVRWSLPLQLLVLFMVSVTAQAATPQVTASLSRQSIALDDTVTLNITVAGSTQGSQPDFNALNQDFQILNTGRTSSMQIINGQRSASLKWSLLLKPQHAGTLRIPSFDVNGAHTRALTLTVKATSPQASGGPGDAVFMQATPSTTTPYVGQQVTLSVKLFYAVSLANGSLGQPAADGLDVRQLAHDQRYQTQRNGRSYQVLERKFALFPQHAGRIRVTGIDFKGQALDNGSMPGFFRQARSVQARSAAFTLHVRKPPTKAGVPWIPARNLALNLTGLPKNGTAQVGEPLTLTLTELAVGIPFESLPKPTLPSLKGAQIYPDKPEDSSKNDSAWLIGKRSRSFAVVPTQAGTLTIPRITLSWWNVVKDAQETASLPAHTLTVVPAAGTTATQTSQGASPAAASSSGSAPADSTSSARAPGVERTPAEAHGRSGAAVSWWRRLALAGFGLWLLTAAVVLLAVYWLRARRRRVGHPAPESPVTGDGRRYRNAFLAAVRSGDIDAQATTLLAWAQSERPGLAHLGALRAALGDADQRAVVDALQQRRFSAHAGDMPPTDQVAALFRGGLRWQKSGSETASPLPPLYPKR